MAYQKIALAGGNFALECRLLTLIAKVLGVLTSDKGGACCHGWIFGWCSVGWELFWVLFWWL